MQRLLGVCCCFSWRWPLSCAVAAAVPRVSQAAVSLDSLPPIDAILISSLRYDAYDYSTVRQLCRRDGSTLFVPEGAYARRYFSPKIFGSVYPMQWGDRVKFDHLTVCFTPAIHAAVGRYLWDYGVPGYGGFVLHWTISSLQNNCGASLRRGAENTSSNHPRGVQTPRSNCSSGVHTPERTPAGDRLETKQLPRWEDVYPEVRTQQQQQQPVVEQKTVYYAGRTAYSGRLFDMIRNAAATDREQLAELAVQEGEWKAHVLQQHEEYLRRTAATQKLEELLLLPPASSTIHYPAFKQQQKCGNAQQQQEPQRQQQRMHGPDQNQHRQEHQSTSLTKKEKDGFTFDLSILPIGGYEPRPYMQRYQMIPEEAVEAHLRLRSRVSVASHFDVFPVGSEPFGEAAERMRVHCKKKLVSTVYGSPASAVSDYAHVSDDRSTVTAFARMAGSPGRGSAALDKSAEKQQSLSSSSINRVHSQSSSSSSTCASIRTSRSLGSNSSMTRSMETSARCAKSGVNTSVPAEKQKINATARAAEQQQQDKRREGRFSAPGGDDAGGVCFQNEEQQTSASSAVEDKQKALQKRLESEREKEKSSMLALQPGEYVFVF